MSASTPFTSAFDKAVQDSLDRWRISGVSISVVHDTDSWSKGYGLAHRDSGVKVEPSTLFYVASTTKAHLCVAWATYINSKANQVKPKHEQVTWSTPLANIIRDDFVLSDSARTAQVTLEDCVSHRTGLPRHESSYGYEGRRTVKDVTRNLRNLAIHNELRAEFEYCNIAFVAASHALETVTGQSLAEILRQYIYAPLGMSHTHAGFGEASEAVKSKGEVLAKGYNWSKSPMAPEVSKGQYIEQPWQDFPEVSGAGYVISTADDYTKWMHALLHPAEGGPITQEIRDEVWKPRSIVPPSDHSSTPFDGVLTYGLGWFISTYRGYAVYWHTGGVTGAGSFILLVPELKWGVSYFSNGSDTSLTLKGLTAELLDATLNIPEKDRTALKKTEEKVVETYNEFAREYETARTRFYPSAPSSPNVHLSLPLEQYAGTYRSMGYGQITLAIGDDANGKAELKCHLFDRTWWCTYIFEHVNGEYWLVTKLNATTSSASRKDNPTKSATKAQSRIGVDGRVEAFGIAMEVAMEDDLIWFTRES